MKPFEKWMNLAMSHLTAEENIIIDLTGKQNGRGAYICRSEECLKRAMKTKAIERSLSTSISAEVYDELKKELGE